MWQLVLRLVSPLDSRQQQQEQPEGVRDGHGRSFGSCPWQKQDFAFQAKDHGKKSFEIWVTQI